MTFYFLLYGVLGLIALRVVGALTLFQRIAGMTLRRPRWRVCAADEAPHWLHTLAEPARTRLAELGFVPAGALAAVAMDRQSECEGFDLLFHHPELGVYAFVYALPTVSADRPVFVDFVSFFDTPPGWRPAGGPETPSACSSIRMSLARAVGVTQRPMDEVEIVSLPHLSLGRRWARHRFDVEGRAFLTLTPTEIAAVLEARHGATYAAMLQSGEGVARGPDSARYSVRAALQVTRTVMKGGRPNPPASAEFHGAYSPDRLGEPAPPGLAAAIHEELNRTNAAGGQSRLRVWIFGATLVLFAATLMQRVGLDMLALLIGVLIVHELGHLLAMRAFGYRDTTVYFLPFFGAAASGDKPEATLSERALVLLAGPLPGLWTGLALLWIVPVEQQGHTLQLATLLLVFVNLFNLLPVLPLDGGRLVERALFQTSPRAEALFKLVSAAALLASGPLFDEWILPWIGILIALTLPTTVRVGRALQTLPPDHGRPTLTELYAHLDAIGFGGLRFVRKYNLARELEQRLQMPPARIGARLAWFAVYVFSLGAGLVVADRLLP